MMETAVCGILMFYDVASVLFVDVVYPCFHKFVLLQSTEKIYTDHLYTLFELYYTFNIQFT